MPVLKLISVLAVIALTIRPALAAPLDNSDPTAFFNTLASRLVKSEMNLDLARLQIWPTNQYTPAVHRLLQVTANIYEATTNRFNDTYPHLPTVFRPRFTNDNGTVFITGYVEETNSAFLTNSFVRQLAFPDDAASIQPDDLIFGFPPILGAKKGLPNFNEFAMETVVQLTRKVELVKSAPGGADKIIETNQMFIIGISNVVGAEFWDSYTTSFPRAVDIRVFNFGIARLTNDWGFSQHVIPFAQSSFFTNSWPKWNPQIAQAQPAFIVPLRTNQVLFPDYAFRFSTTNFNPITTTFERPSGFAFPRWGLTITNRVFAYVTEHDTSRVIDVVTLGPMVDHYELSTPVAQSSTNSGFAGVWATNIPPGETFLSDHPGIYQQVMISLGFVEHNGNWQNYGIGQPSGMIRDQAIANFFAFFAASHQYTYFGENGFYNGTNTSLVANVPFTPTAKFSFQSLWQARDPLVHYLSSDLLDRTRSGVLIRWLPSITVTNIPANLGRLNFRYQPWSDYPNSLEDDPEAMNLALKDPGIMRSDNWSFPDSEQLSIPMLARIHRGTPWQTLYLKSTDAPLGTWTSWTGNTNASDALHSRPVRDWPLLALIASMLNTNPPQTLLSINDRNTDAWLAALGNISVLTNSASDDYVIDNATGYFDTLAMSSNSPQAAVIENALRSARDAQPDGYFRDAGDILSAPELSVASPWLNLSEVQMQYGLNDTAYEAIPAQLLSRVRADSIGTVLPDHIQFTGYDDYPYAIEHSTNLSDWIPISTNWSTNGVFEISLPPNINSRFFRSRLLP